MGALLRKASLMLRLMVGVPEYAAYLEHMRLKHPQQKPMSEAQFIANRQQARFGSGQGKCC